MQRFVPGGSVYFGLHVPKNNTTDLTKKKKWRGDVTRTMGIVKKYNDLSKVLCHFLKPHQKVLNMGN